MQILLVLSGTKINVLVRGRKGSSLCYLDYCTLHRWGTNERKTHNKLHYSCRCFQTVELHCTVKQSTSSHALYKNECMVCFMVSINMHFFVKNNLEIWSKCKLNEFENTFYKLLYDHA